MDYFFFIALFAALQGFQPPSESDLAKEAEAIEYKVNCQKGFALYLLTSLPHEIPDETCKDEFLRMSISREAVKLQILDSRETSYIMAKQNEFKQDLMMLQKRYQDLKDAPFLEDVHFLPPKILIDDLISQNRAFHKKMNERLMLELDRKDMISNVLAVNSECYKILDLMRDSRCDFYYTTVRRSALKRFKELMQNNQENEDGASYWDTGRLPPAAPYWMVSD